MAVIKGRLRVDRKTKHLIERLQPGEIAVIDHVELDEVAAWSLVERRPAAVVNAAASLNGSYPNRGPLVLLQAGIPVLDETGRQVLELVQEGQEGELVGEVLRVASVVVARGQRLRLEEVLRRLKAAEAHYPAVFSRFVTNTLEHASQELEEVQRGLEVPALATVFKGRQAVVVVRGQDYKQDLAAIRPYLQEVRPVLVGVDGGADALLQAGWRPDLIIGDMDSVSDWALRCGAELVVHAYRDGSAPGLARVERLKLAAKVIPAPGTSEDLALLLAHQEGAELTVVVGSHSNPLDFLNKGREGMASTLLVRLMVGATLVDAKGVNRLYRQRLRAGQLAGIMAAALLPLAVVLLLLPSTRDLLHLLLMRLQLVLLF